jgi:hypothetical protein
MARAGHNPFDKGPAEGSRDIVEGELTRHQRADNEVDHLHGVKVSGQPQRGRCQPSLRWEESQGVVDCQRPRSRVDLPRHADASAICRRRSDGVRGPEAKASRRLPKRFYAGEFCLRPGSASSRRVTRSLCKDFIQGTQTSACSIRTSVPSAGTEDGHTTLRVRMLANFG